MIEITSEQRLKLIDVAKGVADIYAAGSKQSDSTATVRTQVDSWMEAFDRAYKAIKATVLEEEEKA